jgi:hypothetical protein
MHTTTVAKVERWTVTFWKLEAWLALISMTSLRPFRSIYWPPGLTWVWLLVENRDRDRDREPCTLASRVVLVFGLSWFIVEITDQSLTKKCALKQAHLVNLGMWRRRTNIRQLLCQNHNEICSRKCRVITIAHDCNQDWARYDVCLWN